MNISSFQAFGLKETEKQSGWAYRFAQLDLHRLIFFWKRGGHCICRNFHAKRKEYYVCAFIIGPPYLKSTSIVKGGENPPVKKIKFDLVDSDKMMTVQHLIRAADLARARGYRCATGNDPTKLEELGIAINMLRRSRKIDLGVLASQIPCKIEEIIALEAGLLPFERVCQLLPFVALHLGVCLDAYAPGNLLSVIPN